MTRLKELRKLAGYTQDKLAKALSVSRSTVAMWETSSHAPDYQTLAKLAEIFGVSADSGSECWGFESLRAYQAKKP